MTYPAVSSTLEVAPLSSEERRRLIRSAFETHYERVFFFLSRRVSAEQAEDLAQEVFFRLLKHSRLETIEITVSYLFKIADNLVKNTYKRDSRRRELAEQLQETERVRQLDSDNHDPSGFLDRDTLLEVMKELTANERSAITLIVCQGLSYESASMALGVSVTTINNWKHRGVRKLKQHAEQQEYRNTYEGGWQCSASHCDSNGSSLKQIESAIAACHRVASGAETPGSLWRAG